MSKLDITLGEVMHVRPESRVRVIAGEVGPERRQVVVKEYTFTDFAAANIAVREAIVMTSLAHPNIVKLYDFYLKGSQAGELTLNLVLERMENNLGECIAMRSAKRTQWTEQEIWEILRKLVFTLAFAEQHGVSHRDIKPQNVFLLQGTVKIGDFGASTNLLHFSKTAKTIVGSPLYLSPELKEAYIRFLQTSEKDVDYDPIKSDVYSLGVTMLEMALLHEPRGLSVLKDLQQNTETLIGSLTSYPQLQPWIWSMLAVNAENRPTFQQLEDYILQVENTCPDAPLQETHPQTTCPCGNPIPETPWYDSAPKFLAEYRNYFPYYCSEECLSRSVELPPKKFCVRCKLTTDFIELECGHRLHSKCWEGFKTECLACPHRGNGSPDRRVREVPAYIPGVLKSASKDW